MSGVRVTSAAPAKGTVRKRCADATEATPSCAAQLVSLRGALRYLVLYAMPRLSGAAEPPALHRRSVSNAAPAVAAPAVASPAAPRPPAPARDATPAPSRPAPTPPAAAPRARAEVDSDGVPPPPKHDFLKEPKLYRQEDGTLGPTKPPPNPYTVVRVRLALAVLMSHLTLRFLRLGEPSRVC